MIVTMIRLMLLCASMVGYMRLVSRRIAPELSIGFTFAGIASAMTLAGVLNALPEAAILLCAGGLYSLVWTLVKDRRARLLTLGGAFFLVMCAVLAARQWGEVLIHYDNFSHWGMIVKHMLTKDRLPNYSDQYILFQSYPPGAAAFIYYCAKLSGIRAEWFQMLAHWACAAGMLSGMFALAKGVPAKLACFAGAMLILCGDNNFNQLLVDSTLAVAGLGAVSFCAYYRRDLRRVGLYIIPWLTYLIALKNSGALFAVYALVLVFLWSGFKKGVVAAIPPALMLLIWNRHVSYVFEQGLLAAHSMSISNFKRMLSAKRAGSVESIVRQMLGKVFSLSNAYLAVLLLSVAAFIFVCVYLKRDRLVRGLLIYGVAAYLIYQAGTLGMYIFTMNERQALQLASYPRYHGTIWMFSAGVALMAVLMLADRLREKPRGGRWTRVCCGACVVALAVSGMPHYTHYTRYLDAESLDKLPIRRAVDAVIAEYEIPPEASYYVLVGDDFAATPYLTNAMNCLLLAKDVQVRRLSQILDMDEAFKSEYLVAFEDSPEVMDYVEEHFGSRERFITLSEVERQAAPEADTAQPGNLAALMGLNQPKQAEDSDEGADDKAKQPPSGNLAGLMGLNQPKQAEGSDEGADDKEAQPQAGNLAALMGLKENVGED